MSLRAALPIAAKKIAWNLKYKFDRCPRFSPANDAVAVLSALPHNSRILELGCGRGSLLLGLRRAGWRGHFRGVDISRNAIAHASSHGDSNSSWVTSDIESFRTCEKWDAVAMVESLYYVALGQLEDLLPRAMTFLSAGGFLLIRLHNIQKHQLYFDAVLRLFPRTQQEGSLLLIRNH